MMKYIVMYLICGVAWAAWLYFELEEHFNSQYVHDISDETKKKLFKNGVVLGTETVKKILVSCILIWFVLSWPYQVFETIRCKIKRH